ncbi:hypothetical protein JOC37_000062 [Desulfohalotomaculum tongense]|uniref:hypothetical protein n=1 Tax=Desulforadius tongensis TaxID=1216062 RepID=UPI00195C1EDA|nr:hypothetical protein [Desulforadius tongensis]MBM7853697.1 hypothetical protein [Desulforadius tongensis]
MYKLKSPRRLTVVIGLAVLLVTVYAGMLWAGAGEPGTSADPLVTKSYVEKYVNEKLGQGAGQWLIKEIKPGGVFKGGSGTEVVLRSGKATCIDPTTSGILDLTKGGNVVNGQKVPPNHLLVIPRNDGRGLKADTAIIIMYRGTGVVE